VHYREHPRAMVRFSTPARCASGQAIRKQRRREIQGWEAGSQIPQAAPQSKKQKSKEPVSWKKKRGTAGARSSAHDPA
jgi:hypothetical protein